MLWVLCGEAELLSAPDPVENRAGAVRRLTHLLPVEDVEIWGWVQVVETALLDEMRERVCRAGSRLIVHRSVKVGVEPLPECFHEIRRERGNLVMAIVPVVGAVSRDAELGEVDGLEVDIRVGVQERPNVEAGHRLAALNMPRSQK